MSSLIKLVGSTIESGASAASAAIATALPKRRRRPSIADASLEAPFLCGFSQLQKDPFKGKFRKRALDDPERALETLGPYASLDLTVVCAKDLVPKDETVIFAGTSDPYVEVWLNDVKQGASQWRLWSTNPRWDFQISLDLFSPMSIVQLRVMDRDTFTRNDLVGFVEFCVADLEPNVELIGWFELRHFRRMTHTADKRIYQHMKHRDDDRYKHHRAEHKSPPVVQANVAQESVPEKEENASLDAKLEGEGVQRKLEGEEGGANQNNGCTQEPTQPQRASSTGAIGSRRSRRCRLVSCRGKPPIEDDLSRRLNTNAGVQESFLRSREVLGDKEAEEKPELNWSVTRSSLQVSDDGSKRREDTLGTKPLRPNAGELLVRVTIQMQGPSSTHADDLAEHEFYAFCMPEPRFHRFSEKGSDHEHTLDFPEIYDDLHHIYTMLVTNMMMKAFCVVDYLMTWRCIPLTFLLWLWWVLFCLRTTAMLWTLPVWVAFLFNLLRRENWRMVMVAHPNTAALNDAGYNVIASLRNSEKMEIWLKRVIRSLHGRVAEKHYEERRKVAEAIFRDGKALMTFKSLCQLLESQKWIEWNHGKLQKCEKRHTLQYEGETGENYLWKCMSPKGCCHHIKKHNSGNVGRYHCGLCNFDMCEYCVISTAELPVLVGIPRAFMPNALVELFRALEFPAHDARHLIQKFLESANLLFMNSTRGMEKSRRFYEACAYTSAALVALPLILQYDVLLTGTFTRYAWRGLCIFLGSIYIFWRQGGVKRGRNALQAYLKLHKFQHRRSTGGCDAHWEFFVPADVPSHQAEQTRTRTTGDHGQSGTEWV